MVRVLAAIGYEAVGRVNPFRRSAGAMNDVGIATYNPQIMWRISVPLLIAVLACVTQAATSNHDVDRLVAVGKLWATIKSFTWPSPKRIRSGGIKLC